MSDIVVESQADMLREVDRTEQGDVRTEEMLVNMGPQHPSTHGELRLVLRTDGEKILEAVPYSGYLHRCAEKIGENLAPYQFVPYTDRMDYLASMNNNQGLALAVEKLAGLEVPERAKYIRVIFAELNRIASHLVAIGCFGLDMGAWSPLLYCFREREMILDLFEATCGARLTYSYITPGGVTRDLPDDFVDRCTEFVDYFEPKIEEYNGLLSYNHIFVKRTAQVGVVSAEDAIAYGWSGPNLRGSGIKFDPAGARESLTRWWSAIPGAATGCGSWRWSSRCGSSASACEICRRRTPTGSATRRTGTSSCRPTRSTSRSRTRGGSWDFTCRATGRPSPAG